MPVDYTTLFGTGNSRDSQPPQRWWTVDDEDAPSAISAVIRAIHQYSGRRLTQQLISARLYGNVNLMGLNGLTYAKLAAVQNTLRDRISYNIVQSAVDTVTAKMAKNRPRPLFLTSGGDYRMQRKAKRLSQFMDGIFYENKAHDLGTIIFRDACVFGEGVVHVFEHDGRVKYERVLSSELFVDEMEAFYGRPRSMHWVKAIDRDVLLAMFPEHEDTIKKCNSNTADKAALQPAVTDTVEVRESWHLPSGPDAGDGRHMITLGSGTLLNEEYTQDCFPFAFFRWSPRLFGFWGQGLAEQIQNIQLEVNKILWVIQRSFHLMGSFKIWLKIGSKTPTAHLSNDIGAIIEGEEPPQYIVPPVVQPEMYQHLQTLKNAAYEQAGISQLSASSKKPEGLDSGKALREFNDIESERFMTVGKAYERLFLDITALTLMTAKAMSKRKRAYTVQVPGKDQTSLVDWKDVHMEEDEFIMQVFPVSSLPNDPSGRLQTINEYIQAGFMSPRTGRRLLDFPDMEAEERMANAASDWLHEILEKMLYEGEYTTPEPFDDLVTARELALSYYAWGKTQNVEEDKLDLIRRFLSQLDTLTGVGAPPPLTPQAAPMPQPTSSLVPNVPGSPPAGPSGPPPQ